MYHPLKKKNHYKQIRLQKAFVRLQLQFTRVNRRSKEQVYQRTKIHLLDFGKLINVGILLIYVLNKQTVNMEYSMIATKQRIQ